MLLQDEQMHKMTTISLKMVEVVILSLDQLVTTVIFFQLEISHVFHGPTARNQYKCRTPSPCIMRIPLLQKFNNDIFI